MNELCNVGFRFERVAWVGQLEELLTVVLLCYRTVGPVRFPFHLGEMNRLKHAKPQR